MGWNHSYRKVLQTFPPNVSETIRKCARAPGFQMFCWGLCWNNNLSIHVSEDRSRAQGRWLCGLAQQQTAQKTGKQTLTDRWASQGCWAPWGGSQMESREFWLASWHQALDQQPGLTANNNVCPIRSGLDHETDQLFQRGKSLGKAPGQDYNVYKDSRWVNRLLKKK